MRVVFYRSRAYGVHLGTGDQHNYIESGFWKLCKAIGRGVILLNILTVWLFGWGMLYVISFSALEALTGGQHGTYTPLLALPGMMCGVFAAWGFTARRQDAQVAHSWGIAASFMYAWLGLALLMETFSNTPGLVPDGTAHWSTGVVVAVEGILLFCFFRAKLRRAFE